MKINPKEYIDSGILELYACGLLDNKEAANVEEAVKSNSEIAKELREIQDALADYGMLHRTSLNPELKKKVMDRISEAEKKRSTGHVKPWKNKFRVYLTAAAWLFFILNVILNIVLYIKLSESENINRRLSEENSTIKEDYRRLIDDIKRKSEVLKFITNKENRIFNLKGSAISFNSSAKVFWDPETGKIMLSVHNLPIPPSDKQYQLWALKDGKPIDAGVFNLTGDLIEMEAFIKSADTFAVTLEKKGGSPVPDLSQLYLIGGS